MTIFEPCSIHKAALSVLGLNREYGAYRTVIAAVIYAGDLSAARLSEKRLVVLRTDLETWLQSKAIQPDSHALSFVERRLEREGYAA